MRILIVEDESKTSQYLRKGLLENGFVVDSANDGLEALYLIENNTYDLVVLDIMLPKLDGWSVLKKLRAHNTLLPVICLTARDAIDDRVKGLELGADDYLIKPFAFSELMARIHSLLRRGQQQQIQKLNMADLEIDLLKQRVKRNMQIIRLTGKEFNLLTLLMKHQGEILSRTFIAERIWDMNFDSDTNIIDVAIRRLRKKIDEGFEKKLIHTIRGVGYMMDDKYDF